MDENIKKNKRTKERLEYGFQKKKYQNQVMAWFYWTTHQYAYNMNLLYYNIHYYNK